MKLIIFLFPALILSLLFIRCGDLYPSAYTVVPPSAPEAWVSALGEPHWRLEWLDKNGIKRTADLLPGESIKIEIPVTWANPVTAWPYWPEHNLPAGVFRPAGALFPFDAEGGRLRLNWKAGVDTVFYWELALADDGQNAVKIPANFDWPRFRELLNDEDTKEEVRKDPWLVDWRSVAEKTISSRFDRRRLVPEASVSMPIPLTNGNGPWYGTSPFGEPLYFNEGDTPVFPVRPGLNVLVSPAGILRCTGKTWTLSPLSTKLSIGYYDYNYYEAGAVFTVNTVFRSSAVAAGTGRLRRRPVFTCRHEGS